jgi:hypothetical protein
VTLGVTLVLLGKFCFVLDNSSLYARITVSSGNSPLTPPIPEGIIMTTLISAADVVRSTFNFTVDKLRLEGPDGFKTPYYGLFKSDDNSCLNAVTAKYSPHTTDDVVVLVEAAQAAFDDGVNVQCHWRNGHYVVVEPTREHRKAVYGTADNIFPRMIVSAGYDDRPFRASLGMFRDACLNLARLKQVSGTSVSIRHTMSLRPRLNELIDVFSGLKDGWKSVTETVAEMEARQVSLVSFLDAVYPLASDATPRSVTIHKNRTEAIVKRVMSECYRTGRTFGGDFMVSRWMAYNSVQGYVQHVQRAGKGGDRMSRMDQTLMALEDVAVDRAEALAIAA